MKTYKITLTKPNAFFSSASCDSLDEFLICVSVVYPSVSKKMLSKIRKVCEASCPGSVYIPSNGKFIIAIL